MDKLVYIAMSGAKQMIEAQAVHANNLANSATHGFKADMVQARSMPVFGDVYASRVYSMTERPSVDFSTGSLDKTDRDLDLAIAGDGWFTVLDEQGNEALTRSGNLSVDESGYLVTQQGHILMGNAGPVVLPPYEKLEIATDGTITVQALGQGPDTLAEVNRLKLANPNLEDIYKRLDGLYERRDGQIPFFAAEVRVKSGFLETSNANALNSMVEIIKLSRQFEMQYKFMKKAEEMDASSARLLQS